MNKELLKQLQLQAGGSHYPDINPEIQARFANLVVQECIDTLHRHGWTDAANDMKQHFGVEE